MHAHGRGGLPASVAIEQLLEFAGLLGRRRNLDSASRCRHEAERRVESQQERRLAAVRLQPRRLPRLAAVHAILLQGALLLDHGPERALYHDIHA